MGVRKAAECKSQQEEVKSESRAIKGLREVEVKLLPGPGNEKLRQALGKVTPSRKFLN